MSKTGIVVCGVLWCVLVGGGAHATEDRERTAGSLEEIVVQGARIMTPTKQSGETVYTGMEVTEEGIALAGEKGKSSVYEVVSILPGVVFESPDPYNLAAEQANVRIRGVRGYLGAMTVEGVPNYGGNPMGPRDYLYDTENVESVAL